MCIVAGVTTNEEVRGKWSYTNPYDNGCYENFKAFCCSSAGPSISELAGDDDVVSNSV